MQVSDSNGNDEKKTEKRLSWPHQQLCHSAGTIISSKAFKFDIEQKVSLDTSLKQLLLLSKPNALEFSSGKKNIFQLGSLEIKWILETFVEIHELLFLFLFLASFVDTVLRVINSKQWIFFCIYFLCSFNIFLQKLSSDILVTRLNEYHAFGYLFNTILYYYVKALYYR